MDLFDVLGPFGGSYLFLLTGALLAARLVRWAGQQLQRTAGGEGSVPASSGLTGGAVAQRLLTAIGLDGVRLVCSGKLNCYHPRRREVRLRDDTFASPSLTATAIAAHEVGHAQQFAAGYFACQLYRVFWPICWGFLAVCLVLPCLAFAGVQLPNLCQWVCAIAFVSLFLQLIVHLPLEWDASRRAATLVRQAGLLNAAELPVFERVLGAAGRTHLAAHGQRWLFCLLAAGMLVWGIPQLEADNEANARFTSVAVVPATPPAAPPATAEQPPVPDQPVLEIDLLPALLSTGALAVPVVLVLVVAALMRTDGRRQPNALGRAVQRNNAALTLFERGQLAEAVAEYAAALELDPAMIAARYNRGMCHFRLGRLDEALADLDEVIRRAPGFADARALRGAVWDARGDAERALADWSETLLLTPRHNNTLLYRINFWLHRGDFDQAIADCTAALENDPAQPAVLRDRGLAWIHKGILYRAASDLDESIRLNATDAVTFNNRGAVFLKAGHYPRALADLCEATRLAPEFPNPHKHLAWLRATCIQAEFRDGAEALASAVRALELSGWKPVEWLGVLAAAHAEAGNFEQAIHWQTRCLNESPPEAQLQAQDRLALYQAGQPFRDPPCDLV